MLTLLHGHRDRGSWTNATGFEQVFFTKRVQNDSPVARDVPVELDFFLPACPSVSLLTFSAADISHFD